MLQVGAADLVMEALLNGDDDKISKKLLTAAIMHGLSKHFSFTVGQVYEAVVDACMETEWYFPVGKDTPAQIAKFLSDKGFVWDKDMQKNVNADIIGEIKTVLEAPKAPAKKPAPRRRGGFGGPFGGCWG